MGGRGTFAAGNPVPYSFETIGFIEGVKVLSGLNGVHGLPEESHSSNAYIQLRDDGSFKTLRLYDDDHFLTKEIAYHQEKSLDKSGKWIIHIHEYSRDDFGNRTTRLLTKSEYNKYKKYFIGVSRWKTDA